MKKEYALEYISAYKDALKYIDKKIPLLEHSDTELEQQKKKLKRLNRKLKGLNFVCTWIVVSVLTLFPMSILNFIIETDFNFFYITPVVSFVVLYLYKVKYSKGTQKTQIKATTDIIDRLTSDNKSLIGEINYAQSLANEALTILLLSDKDKTDKNILDCDLLYTNLTMLEYAYGYVNNIAAAPVFEDATNSFRAVLNQVSKNSDKNTELYKQFHKEALQAEYRRGALKRCAKLTGNIK